MYQPTNEPNPRMTRLLVEHGAFRDAPLRVIDGGARAGLDSRWEVFGGDVDVIGFEPDPSECDSLNRNFGSTNHRFYPVALGRSKGTVTINVARYPDSSSVLPLNEEFAGRFAMGRQLETVDTLEVEATGVDTFLHDSALTYLDFLKLDVEGAELEVLLGAERALQSVVALNVEVWFHCERKGRPHFGEIDEHLRQRGFSLFDFRELNRWGRKTLAPDSRDNMIGAGQLLYANAVYFKDLPALIREGATTFEVRAVLALASLAELHCYPDFAIEVLEAARNMPQQSRSLIDASALISALRHHTPAVVESRAQRVIRSSFRRLVPPRLRRRLVKTAERLLVE